MRTPEQREQQVVEIGAALARFAAVVGLCLAVLVGVVLVADTGEVVEGRAMTASVVLGALAAVVPLARRRG